MAIEISWYFEDRVILWAQDIEPEDEEVLAVNEQVKSMMDESAGELPVHYIVYLAEEGTGVQMANPDRIRRLMTFQDHPRCGEIVIYGNPNPVVNMVVRTFGAIAGASVNTVESRDEAVAFLKSKDSTLANMT